MQYAEAVEAKSGYQGVWRFVDGTLRPICRPTRNQRVVYSMGECVFSCVFRIKKRRRESVNKFLLNVIH
ncbi:hypothetical protein V1519DRAFT_438775 [Lipomyces tetrasporus]